MLAKALAYVAWACNRRDYPASATSFKFGDIAPRGFIAMPAIAIHRAAPHVVEQYFEDGRLKRSEVASRKSSSAFQEGLVRRNSSFAWPEKPV